MLHKFLNISVATIFATVFFCSCSQGGEKQEKHIFYEYSEVDTTGNEWFKMDISVYLPTEEVSPFYKEIKSSLISEYFGSSFADMSIKKLIRAYTDTARAYFHHSNYEYLNITDDEDKINTPIVLRYEEVLKIFPHYECDSVITYARDLYIFQGGAHGLGTRQYIMFNLNNGERIELSNIYKDTYLSQLTQKLYAAADKMRENNRLPQSDEIFNNSLIEPTNNFYLKDSSIIFRYNPYDIAPYCYGAIEIEVTK